MHSLKKIPVANLTVNIENPRYEMVGNQPEAINLMVKEQNVSRYLRRKRGQTLRCELHSTARISRREHLTSEGLIP